MPSAKAYPHAVKFSRKPMSTNDRANTPPPSQPYNPPSVQPHTPPNDKPKIPAYIVTGQFDNPELRKKSTPFGVGQTCQQAEEHMDKICSIKTGRVCAGPIACIKTESQPFVVIRRYPDNLTKKKKRIPYGLGKTCEKAEKDMHNHCQKVAKKNCLGPFVCFENKYKYKYK